MRSPLDDGPLIVLDEVESTQDAAARMIRSGEPVGAVMARSQTAGRGRLGRTWYSPPDECLAVSLVFTAYANWPQPYLIGMATAVAAAEALDLNVRWPNDLWLSGFKAGGILTELIQDPLGRSIPVVGLGLNLSQRSFPADIADRVTSLMLSRGSALPAQNALDEILSCLEILPEPLTWATIEPRWMRHDVTPGKHYKLPSGVEGTALGVGPDGELLCSVGESVERVLAADALV